MPWVTLKTIKHIRVKGVQKTYRPGDSVEVGRQTALEWILDGSAEDPFGQMGPPMSPKGAVDGNFGIRIRAQEGEIASATLGDLAQRAMISYGPPAIPCKYTLIWRPGKVVSPRLLNYGFLRIMNEDKPAEAWEMAACLAGIDRLAKDIGSPREQAKTKQVVGDLRLPVYEPRLIWVRKCPASEEVVAEWARELEAGADEYHAFLRALYTKRAMLCTLPHDWTGR